MYDLHDYDFWGEYDPYEEAGIDQHEDEKQSSVE